MDHPMSGHEILLVRHGQTEWSADGRHTGRTDIPLTGLGRRQAGALGAMLGDTRFAAVLSSPLSRARETMELAGHGSESHLLDDLVEWDYGVYEGRRTADIRLEIPEWSVWTHEIHGGESAEQVGDRADRAIARALAADGPVVLFAHGHVLRILAARWMGLPAAAGRSLRLDTATVSTLGWEREIRVVRHWNEVCHLRSMDPAP
ncbi:MAG: histidine phosphatase family protein [Actinobacteria bacterium]|jgi:probable phosphoglycerate mutase|nr:histidine phosphatase family protein [Actinomycetota bacterium]